MNNRHYSDAKESPEFGGLRCEMRNATQQLVSMPHATDDPGKLAHFAMTLGFQLALIVLQHHEEWLKEHRAALYDEITGGEEGRAQEFVDHINHHIKRANARWN